MKKLLNTLYITSDNKYLSLDGTNVVIKEDGAAIGRMPLHNLEMIVSFSRLGASPTLMGRCAEENISIVFLNPNGTYLARVEGKTRGNVLLRKKQYQVSENEAESLPIARSFILGKVYNARWVIERMKRDHSLQVDTEKLVRASGKLYDSLEIIASCDSKETLRGYEGELAAVYFSVFDEMILQQKEEFYFHERNRRPPLDPVNALLSFCYTLLTNMTAAALETVGLDPCVGFMHGDRPGRYSLALDMMEELRPALADRFVLRLINKRIVTAKDFIKKEDGAVLLTDDARKTVLDEWQKRKQDQILHPFLKEKVQWGMVPHAQAMLLARFLRGDIDAYPPFFWK
ncbi:MAG: type I-C CRISPR-associated endonuclease Cas1 [Roseburia sp.]|nr:type I-C CRISPR-associated endonuclease Cas1 [Roseburia sp.]